MRILERRTYLGPNLYAQFRVIRFLLDLGPLEDHPSATIPGFVDRLIAVLPGLGEHGCSYGAPRRLRAPAERRRRAPGSATCSSTSRSSCSTSPAPRSTFGKTRSAGEPGQYHVVYEYEEARVG